MVCSFPCSLMLRTETTASGRDSDPRALTLRLQHLRVHEQLSSGGELLAPPIDPRHFEGVAPILEHLGLRAFDTGGEFRVVGTTPEFFEKLRHGPNVDQPFEFSQGRALREHSDEYGYFEAVVGSRVARAMEVGVGDKFYPTHGDPSGRCRRDEQDLAHTGGATAPSCGRCSAEWPARLTEPGS